MISILFIAGLIVGFFYLHTRINDLEKTIREMSVRATLSAMPAVGAVTPVKAQEQFVAPVAPPVDVASPVSRSTDESASGQWLGVVGILAVLVGISFFLKFAFENNWIGPMGRVMIGLLSGMVLLGLGQFLKEKYARFTDVLMGGGIAVLYLAVYAAIAFYGLITPSVGFMLMLGITALSVVLSVFGGSATLAHIGVIGGFLTPFLISGNSSDIGPKFVYVLVLDLGILCVSLWKRWLGLNYIGFVGTIIIYSGWYESLYQRIDLGFAFLFLTLYFLIFLFSSVAHHIVQKENSEGVDLGLLTVNALGYFGFTYLLFKPEYPAVLGFLALIMAVIYFVLGYVALLSNPVNKLLNYYLPGLAVVFLSLAIPLQFSGAWVTLAWLVEALVLYAVSFKVNNVSLRVFGAIVFVIALMRYFLDFVIRSGGITTAFFNRQFVMIVLFIVVSYVVALLYRHNAVNISAFEGGKSSMAFFLIIANILTVYGVSQEIYRGYAVQIRESHMAQSSYNQQYSNYRGNEYGYENQVSNNYYETAENLRNQRNIVISIFWALYSILLISIGLVRKSSAIRGLGLILFAITAVKVFVEVWSLGQLYRIISFIVFGIIALIGSFIYTKFKNRIIKSTI